MHQLGRVRVGLCWALTRTVPQSSWRGGHCERTGPSLYGAAGLSRRNFSERKSENKETLGDSLGNSPAAAAPVSSPTRLLVLPLWGGGHRAHIRGTKEWEQQGRPHAHTHSSQDVACLKLQDWGLLGCRMARSWSGMEKS